MLELTSYTTIGEIALRGLTECTIESSWETLTDTCTLTLPRKVEWRGRRLAVGDDSLLRAGQPVDVQLGYDGRNTERFTGVVRSVSAGIPVEVECEDSLPLKRTPLTLSYRDANLKQVLKDVLGSFPYTVLADYRLGKLRITRLTPMQVLSELGKKYGIRAWIRSGRMYVGLAVAVELQRSYRIRFDRNVVATDLEWRRAADVRIKATGVIIRPDATKVEVVVGDPEGETRTFHYYDLTAAEVKALLEQETQRLRYTGYRGTLTTFLEPQIRHGDIVELVNPELPEQDGAYLVSAVKTTFGQGGGRQELTLETRIR